MIVLALQLCALLAILLATRRWVAERSRLHDAEARLEQKTAELQAATAKCWAANREAYEIQLRRALGKTWAISELVQKIERGQV